MNGYLAEDNVRSVDEIIPWIQEAIAHFYPESAYARSLSTEIRERASHQVFRQPSVGVRVSVLAAAHRKRRRPVWTSCFNSCVCTAPIPSRWNRPRCNDRLRQLAATRRRPLPA
jgi:hypothetical protein